MHHAVRTGARRIGALLALGTLSALFFYAPLTPAASAASVGTSDVAAQTSVLAEAVGDSFRYVFKKDGILRQTMTMAASRSRYWWLSSGGALLLQGGKGMTLHGDQVPGSEFHTRYAKYNPEHSDGGLHPQNIFRLITRSTWGDAVQEISATIDRINPSSSNDRDPSDGILLFNRYQDQHTLYYAGIRVDGTAVIKKKVRGTYTTLAQSRVFPGTYDRWLRPNLIPMGQRIGIRSVVRNLADGSVRIEFSLDRSGTGQWERIAVATDDGSKGGPPIRNAGHGGLRSDYMDLTFDDYVIRTIRS